MLIEFDQNTIANMTAALEFVCKKLPADKDNPQTRKQIADALIVCAKRGGRSYAALQTAGLEMLREITRPSGFFWSLLHRLAVRI